MRALCRASMFLLLLVAGVSGAAQAKTAVLIHVYYGDSKYRTLAQESLRLVRAMEGHDFKVLLKHESVPGWADLSERDEKQADVKDLPTKANFFKYLLRLARDGYQEVDVLIFAHGDNGKFKASDGKDGSEDWITESDIRRELDPKRTGLSRIPIRTVWGTHCYGSTLNDTWLAVGARASAGSRHVNFLITAFGPFIDAWNKGNVTFADAVRDADTAGVRTFAETLISTVDAPSQKAAGKWGGCPFGKTVLGSDACAREYFDKCWLRDGEWQAGKSGKENLLYSSTMILAGDTRVAKIPAADQCTKDSECKSTEFCDKDLLHPGRNQCVPRRPDGTACPLIDGGRTCLSWKCGAGHCYTPRSVAMAGTCYVDDACQAGKCSAADGFKGSCVCKADGDCDKGEYCDAGLDLKGNACRAKLAQGEKCGKAGSLGNDHKCKSGECSGFPKYVCK